MKKLLFILIGLLCLTGCSNTKLKDISYSGLDEKMTNKDTFVLYIGSADCTHCQSFKPVLEKVVKKYKLEVYYIDMSLVTNDQYNAVKAKTNMGGTPTLLLVKNGKSRTTSRIVGEQDEQAVINFFKEIGKIK